MDRESLDFGDNLGANEADGTVAAREKHNNAEGSAVLVAFIKSLTLSRTGQILTMIKSKRT